MRRHQMLCQGSTRNSRHSASFFARSAHLIIMAAPPRPDPMFPSLSSHSLRGDRVTLPADCRGAVTLIAIAFQRGAQVMIDSWYEPFSLEFGKIPGVWFYEIPMIGSAYWRVMSGWIDAGMRSGIPANKHPFVITYYGDVFPYRRELGMEDPALAYLFLLDREGRIRWRASGYAEEEHIRELKEQVHLLMREDD